jgi:MFS family permease
VTAAPPGAPLPRRATALVYLANVLFGGGLFAHAFLYNFYLGALGAGEGAMGWAAAALTAGGLAALFPAGLAVDRLGPRAVCVAAAALAAAGLVGGAVAASLPAVYALAAVAGAGTGAWRVATGPLLMAVTREETRARAFSMNVGLLLASGAAWTAAAGALPAWIERTAGLSELASLRISLAATGVGTGLAALAFLRLPADRPSSGATARPRPAARDLALPGPVLAAIALVAAWMLSSALVIPFVNLYFRRVHEMPVERVGYVMAAASAVTAAVVMGSGRAAARWGPLPVLSAWTVVFPLSVAGLGTAAALPLALALYLAQNMAAPATYPLVDQLLLERVEASRRGVLAGWRNLATDGAGFVGAALAGALLERSTFAALFLLAAGIAAVTAPGMLLLLRARGDAARPASPENEEAAAERDEAALVP